MGHALIVEDDADSARMMAALVTAEAMGYGANWITDWYAYDPQARSILGLDAKEQVAGFVLMGTPREPALERERPDPAALVTRWG